jgi:AraC-like DNA-binding protein
VKDRGKLRETATRASAGPIQFFTRAMAEIRTPLWRLVLSYVLLLMIPVCVVFVLFSARFFADYGRSLEADSDRNLQNLSAFVEGEMARIWSKVAQASADPVLSPSLSFRDIPALRKAQMALSAYKAGQSYIMDIGIFLPTIRRLLTARTIIAGSDLPFSVDDLPESLRRGNGGAAVFNSESNAFLMPMEPSLVLVAFPFPVDALASNSFLLVVLNAGAMRRTIEEYFPHPGVAVWIDGGTGVLAASIGTPREMPADTRGASGDVHLNTITPAAGLFRYSSIVSRELILRPLRGLRIIFFLVILGILLFGFGGMYALTAINYRPIRNLRRMIETRLHAHSDERDELRAIEHVVEQYSDGYNRLQQSSSEAAEEHLVTRMILGQVRTLKDMADTLPGSEPVFVEGSYRAIVLALAGPGSVDRARAAKAIDPLRDDSLRVAFRVDANEREKHVVIIANRGDRGNGQALLPTLAVVQRAFSDLSGSLPSVGVGDSCDTPDQVGRSYIQAMACLDYTLVKGRGEIVFFDELPRLPQSDASDLEGPIKDLSLSIREGDGATVARIMGEIAEHIKARRFPLFVAKCACFDLINAVLHTARDCGLSLSDFSEELPLRRLERFRTIDDLSGIVMDLCNAVQCVLKTAHRPFALPAEARAQIQKHFADPDFYIQHLCSSLKTSPSYLSQAFKQAYGTTISEYLGRLRIEEAEKLLRGTDLSVDEIIRKVGYTDRSSFSKKFRTWVGTTPADYRRRQHA